MNEYNQNSFISHTIHYWLQIICHCSRHDEMKLEWSYVVSSTDEMNLLSESVVTPDYMGNVDYAIKSTLNVELNGTHVVTYSIRFLVKYAFLLYFYHFGCTDSGGWMRKKKKKTFVVEMIAWLLYWRGGTALLLILSIGSITTVSGNILISLIAVIEKSDLFTKR